MYKNDHSAVFDGTAENFYEFVWLTVSKKRSRSRPTTVGIPKRRILPLSLGISTLFTGFGR